MQNITITILNTSNTQNYELTHSMLKEAVAYLSPGINDQTDN